MRHARFEQLVLQGVLGTLSKAQARALAIHLEQGCASCQAYLGAALDLDSRLPLAVEPVQPRPEIEGQLLDAIRSRNPHPPLSLRHFSLFQWKPILAAALSALLLMGGFWYVERPDSKGRQAVVSLAQGGIFVDGKAVDQGATLLPGQVISTARGAQARVRIGDKAIFWIKENSEVRLASLEEPMLFELNKGWMLQVVKHGVSYSVKTPLGAAHAHGTVFFAMVESPEEVYFCICRDQLDIDADGIHRSVASQHHAGMELSTESGKLTFELVKPEAHTDADVASLQADLY